MAEWFTIPRMTGIAIDWSQNFCFENVWFASFLGYIHRRSSSQYSSETREGNSTLDIVLENINKKYNLMTYLPLWYFRVIITIWHFILSLAFCLSSIKYKFPGARALSVFVKVVYLAYRQCITYNSHSLNILWVNEINILYFTH